MNQKEIKELIEFLVEKDIAEFELQRGDMKLLIKRGARAQPAPVLQVTPTLAMGHTAAVVSARRTLFFHPVANHRYWRALKRGSPGDLCRGC